jgi:hypothetical protein
LTTIGNMTRTKFDVDCTVTAHPGQLVTQAELVKLAQESN